ncbi:hypothetical protein [Aeromonas sobria]|uniref:hypothetical protein n=1 Tax=Aeromonas sobria TaxID=646 RepID=UPI003D05B8ED
MLKHTLLAATLLGCLPPAWAAETDTAQTRPLFLRGEMNNWEAPAAQQLIQSQPDLLTVAAPLQASHGTYKFKVADAKWKSDTTYGQFDPVSKVEAGKPVIVKAGYQWSDMTFAPAEDGTYLFTLDRRDPARIQLTVSKAQ